MRKGNIKNTRINSEMMKELANIIRGELKDPRIAPMTCVTDVEVAPDLKTCKAYISVLGDDEKRAETLKGLKSSEGYIKRQIASRLNLRNTPTITFVSDTSTEYGIKMNKLIDEVVGVENSDDEIEEELD